MIKLQEQTTNLAQDGHWHAVTVRNRGLDHIVGSWRKRKSAPRQFEAVMARRHDHGLSVLEARSKAELARVIGDWALQLLRGNV